MALTPQVPPRRCDRALVLALAEQGHTVTRSQLARAFEAGQVFAGGKVLKASRMVDGPLVVQVVLPRPQPLKAEPEALPLAVVYEDDDLLVINKPAGMVVHAGPGHPRGTLVNAVLHHLGVGADALPVLPGNDATRPGIVHRLDRDTSGVMVVAKHMEAQERLAVQFRQHALERRYVGVVLGQPTWTSMRVETGHARDPWDRRRFAPRPPRIEVGVPVKRPAVTEAWVHERLDDAAVVEFVLHTGRTHQIRMHARHLGHPILGDRLYGRVPREPALRAAVQALGRQALHARVLGIAHPRDGRALRFEVEMPVPMQALVEALRAVERVGPQ